jgi:enamine deaminase RidA (YjgF/YER057c/UK114 family)
MDILLPEGWKRPRGYSSGTRATGTVVFVAGQIGWNERREFESDDLVEQVRRALRNVAAVLEAGGARVSDVTRMTWYVTDVNAYRSSRKAIGEVYRSIMGDHYPAMTLVNVVALVEPRAKVEIEATAVVEP